MLQITSEIEGKQAYYGDIRKRFEREGFELSGGWEYYEAHFDSILSQHEAVTIYLRLPVKVVQGKLDRDEARLLFGQPFLIKHVVHTGIVEEDFKALDLVGLNQFQAVKDPDDKIKYEEKWKKAGVEAVNRIVKYVH